MRVSTGMLFDLGVGAMQRQQSELLKTQQEIATGRRILTPADDPVAAAQALDVQQASGLNSQYRVNRDYAAGRLQLLETAIARVTGLVQDVRVAAIAAGDGALAAMDRASIALDLEQRYEDLLSIANDSDGEGNFLFSGYRANVRPFAPAVAGVQYLGDDGERLVQATATRQIEVSVSGADVFQRILNGNGTFVAQAQAANTGNGVISAGTVTNSALLTGDSYQITFTVAGSTVTYDVVNTTLGAPVLSAQPFVDGGAIGFDGIQVEVSGVPASGDRFTVTPSAHQDLFATVSALVTLLRAPGSGSPGTTRLTNGLNLAMSNLDRALDHLLARRTEIGVRLRELDTLNGEGEDLGIQHQATLSRLQDVDYAAAISNLGREQMALEAAQKSFLQVTDLTLFDYL